MNKKNNSTYEEFIEDSEQKDLLDKEYNNLLVSELLLALMESYMHPRSAIIKMNMG